MSTVSLVEVATARGTDLAQSLSKSGNSSPCPYRTYSIARATLRSFHKYRLLPFSAQGLNSCRQQPSCRICLVEFALNAVSARSGFIGPIETTAWIWFVLMLTAYRSHLRNVQVSRIAASTDWRCDASNATGSSLSTCALCRCHLSFGSM